LKNMVRVLGRWAAWRNLLMIWAQIDAAAAANSALRTLAGAALACSLLTNKNIQNPPILLGDLS
jgi:hypothetical protein